MGCGGQGEEGRKSFFFFLKFSLLCRHLLTSSFHLSDHLVVGLLVKVSAWRVSDLGSLPLAPRLFYWVDSLKNWYSSGYPAGCLALQGQYWACLAQWKYAVTAYLLMPIAVVGA